MSYKSQGWLRRARNDAIITEFALIVNHQLLAVGTLSSLFAMNCILNYMITLFPGRLCHCINGQNYTSWWFSLSITPALDASYINPTLNSLYCFYLIEPPAKIRIILRYLRPS
jgi:hypothetical protein